MSVEFRFPLQQFGQLRASTQADYLVKHHVPRRGLLIVWGPPKTGKSFWVLDLAMHVATGRNYREFKTKQGAVVYVACEGAAAFSGRVNALRNALDISYPDKIPFYLLASRLQLVSEYGALITDIEKQGVKPDLIVIDTVARTFEGSESDDAAMGNYIKAADFLVTKFSCCVVLIHHCGHKSERPRGHSSLMGAADAQIAVSFDDKERLLETEVEFMKDGVEGKRTQSRLTAVEIGKDDDGEPITTCVVETCDAIDDLKKAVALGARRDSEAQSKVYDALIFTLERNGAGPPPGVAVPDGVERVVALGIWREVAIEAGITKGERPAHLAAFKRAANVLASSGRLGISGEYAFQITKRTG